MLDKLTIRLATISEVPIIIHWTLTLFIMFIVVNAIMSGAYSLLILYPFVIACIVAHEFGHILAARRYDYVCKGVYMTPIGGLAMMENIPYDKPKQEFVITAAGPLVTFGLMIFFGVCAWLLGAKAAGPTAFTVESIADMAYVLMSLNAIWFIFNVFVPAFPMDGGRLLRSTLGMAIGNCKLATKIACRLSQVICVIAGVLSLVYMVMPMMILISIFIFFASMQEYKAVNQDVDTSP